MLIKNGDIVKEVTLINDGALDTVFKIDGRELRYDSDYVERTINGGPTRAAYERALDDYLDGLNEEEGYHCHCQSLSKGAEFCDNRYEHDLKFSESEEV